MRCLAGSVGQNLIFSRNIIITSVGDLKLKFEFCKQLKKCLSWKIFCPVKVTTLLKTILWVAAAGYN